MGFTRWALLAFAAVALAACSTERDCTLIGCNSGVSWQRTIDIVPADVPSLQITVCRNGVCDTARAAPAEDQGLYTCGLSGPLQGGCGVWVATSTSVTISAQITVDISLAADGDVYELRVVHLDGGAPILDTSEAVTYETEQPNGPQCGPTCKKASL